MQGEANFKKRIRVIFVISLILTVVFLGGLSSYIAGYYVPQEMILATWNHLVKAFEYYFGIRIVGPSLQLMSVIVVGAFAIVGFVAFFIGRRS